jgi:hypothetical protein
MTLDEEIIELTTKWYKYVNLDHHKDRDCHWYIQKVWSYGNEPYYEVFHNGYVIDTWTSPKCETEELAQTILRDKLKRELQSAINNLEDIAKDQESLDWFNHTDEEIKKIIEELR